MPAPIPQSMRPIIARPSEGPPPPEPTLLETIGAGFTAARGDNTDRTWRKRNEAYRALVEVLEDQGRDADEFRIYSRYSSAGAQFDYQKIFDTAKGMQARGLFSDLPDDMEAFDQQWLAQDRQVIETAEATAERGGLVPGLIGGIGGAMTDPANLLLLPLGGFGSTVGRRIGSEIAVGAAGEAVLQPIIAEQRKVQGRRDLTLNEALANIGFAGAGAGVLRGGFEAAPHLAKKLQDGTASVLEKAVLAGWDRIPANLRTKWAGELPQVNTPEYDLLMVDTAEQLIGPENISGMQRDALEVVRRDAEFEIGSPFMPTGAGKQLHNDLMGEAFARLMSDNPVQARTEMALPAPPVRRARSVLRDSTAIGTRTVASDAQGRFMQRVRRAESSGDDSAKNPRSSATGRYQFLDETWLTYYKRRFGTGGLSDPQILAKRRDGRIQDLLMSDFTQDNANFLRRRGEALTEGNLYLVHFAGQGGAGKLFAADPSASARSVLGSAVVNANPHLKKMNAGDVIAWAHRAMGQKSAPRADARPQVKETVRPDVDETDYRAQLQDELDEVTNRIATLSAERESAAARSGDEVEIDEPILEPIDDAGLQVRDPEGPSAPPRAAVENTADAPTAEVQSLMPQLREIIADRGRSLNRIDEIAEELGVPAAEVRSGLSALATDGTITVNRRTNNFMRKRERPADGELLEFIARRGGLRDDEGHRLGLIHFSARERREIPRSAQPRILEERRARGSRNWQKMTRGHGPLLRHEGNSIDQIGELLWEEGWFGPTQTTPRPSTDDVLQLIEQRIQNDKPMFIPGQEPEPAPVAAARPLAEIDDEQLSFEMSAIAEIGKREFGLELDEMDPDFLEYAARLRWNAEGGMDDAEAFLRSVNDYAHSVKLEAFARSGEVDYDDAHYDWPQDDTRFGSEDFRYEDDWQGFEPERSLAEAGEGGGEVAPTHGAQLAELPAAERAPFVDPESPQLKAQADSLEHDARMLLGDTTDDPAIAAREKQETQLRAEAPLRGENATGQAQDGTMGAPLFDAADQPEFLLEVEGDAKTLTDILADADAEVSDIKTIRDCL